jgi:group I intron endonuclease
MDELHRIIYKATNKINGKSYIGQTVVGLKTRKRKHIFNATTQRDNFHFHNALKKHDPKNFDWEIIHDNITDVEELNKLEIYYIGLYNTFKNGYNLTFGGASILGFKHSEESKKKISDAQMGKNNPMYGKHHSEEAKRKLSEVRKGKKRSEEIRKKISKATNGKCNPRARAIIINNRYFDIRKEAAKFMNVVPSTIRYRILHKTKWLDYSYA